MRSLLVRLLHWIKICFGTLSGVCLRTILFLWRSLVTRRSNVTTFGQQRIDSDKPRPSPSNNVHNNGFQTTSIEESTTHFKSVLTTACLSNDPGIPSPVTLSTGGHIHSTSDNPYNLSSGQHFRSDSHMLSTSQLPSSTQGVNHPLQPPSSESQSDAEYYPMSVMNISDSGERISINSLVESQTPNQQQDPSSRPDISRDPTASSMWHISSQFRSSRAPLEESQETFSATPSIDILQEIESYDGIVSRITGIDTSYMEWKRYCDTPLM
jgi:hypothetical protein